MYFYRLLTKEELNQKKIHNNKNSFNDCLNTHKYVKGKNYIHLFLNAESCFEDFEHGRYDKCYVARFNIPDEIVCKYGIGIGGYSPLYNSYNKKYRTVYKSGHFWIPEIAIPSDSFNYNWCEEVHKTINDDGKCYLPDNFITDDLYYREIVYDGYLIGYKDEKELLEKYKNMIALKKHIIHILKTTRIVNINPDDLNRDSVAAYYAIANYALINGFINDIEELELITSKETYNKSINITNEINSNIVINKYGSSLNNSFCEKLQILGIDVDYDEIMENINIQKIKTISL